MASNNDVVSPRHASMQFHQLQKLGMILCVFLFHKQICGICKAALVVYCTMGKVCDIDMQSYIVQIRAHTHPVSGISVPLLVKSLRIPTPCTAKRSMDEEQSEIQNTRVLFGRNASGTRCNAAEVVPSTAQTFANWKSQRTSA